LHPTNVTLKALANVGLKCSLTLSEFNWLLESNPRVETTLGCS
jgi:hypothetical protein